MGRSQETFSKKEVRSKNEKKRKDKEQKRAKKKSEGKVNSFNDMIAYVDQYGKITSTPPDPDKIVEIVAENIELKITRNKPNETQGNLHKGVVTKYNSSRGFGFIRDLETNNSFFVHANSLEEDITENNIVIFEIGSGSKGPVALKVSVFRGEEAKEA
jgi:cold shock CspA family protein